VRAGLWWIGLVTLVTPGAGAAAVAPPPPAPIALHAYRSPPRWPEQGHRHLHPSGAVLCFDADLGVYAVVGSRDVYFFDDAFLRFAAGRWEGSDEPFGPWRAIPTEWVPIRLRVKHYVRESR
jgi:hypothetical protein